MSARPTLKTIWLLFVTVALSACGDNTDADILAPSPIAITADKPTTTPIPAPTLSNNSRIEQITFTDAKLAACIEVAAKTNQWSFAHQVTHLNCANKSINSLGGIQSLWALQSLDLQFNQITVLKPIAQLSELQILNLAGNGLVNINPLANLTALTDLNLGVTGLSRAKNNIRNIAPLANLTSLKILDVSNNQIGDISPLRNLQAITGLQLSGNQIRNINVLFNIDYTAVVNLHDNNNITCAELNELETTITQGRITRPDDCIFTLEVLIADVDFTDPQLKACVLDTASSEGWMSIAEMTSLACDEQGLTSLNGLQSLQALNYLDLRANKAIDISPLFELGATGAIDLSNNHQIACVKLDALEAVLGTGVITRGRSCSEVTLISDLDFVDPVLESCVRYSAQLFQWHKIEQMTSLRCDNASSKKIEDLRGIEQLIALENIRLEGRLASANDITALFSLAAASNIDLSANTQVACHDLDNLENTLTATIIRPVNCRQ